MGATIVPGSHHRFELLHPMERWRAAGATERTALGGIVGFVAFLVAGIVVLAADGVTGSPASDATDREIADFFADHRLAHLANMQLAAVATLVCLPLFAVAFARLVRRAEPAGGDHLASTVVLVAGVVAAVPALLTGLAWGAAAYHVARDATGATHALYDLGNLGFTVMAYPMAALLAGASIGARRAGTLLPDWLATAGLVLAPLVALSGVVIGAVVFGFVAFALWAVTASWILLGASPSGH